MEPELRHPRLPGVEHGVLLGFMCPRCYLFTSKYAAGSCGCYACTFCHWHVPQAVFDAACQMTGFLVNHPSSS